MADPRETARAWLAERMERWLIQQDADLRSVEQLADAILEAGVRVEQFVVLDPTDMAARWKRLIVTLPDLPIDADDFDWVMEQVTGALPAQPIGETT